MESAARDPWMVENGKGIDWLAEPTNRAKADLCIAPLRFSARRRRCKHVSAYW